MKIFDYIFFLRPVLFFPAWSSMLLYNILCAKQKMGQLLGTNSSFSIAMLAFAFLMAASFILNQLADLETDRVNKKLFFLHEGIIKKWEAIFLSTIFASIGLFISYNLSYFQFLLGLAFFITAGVLYNFKPFRLKQYLIGGFLANVLMGLFASVFTVKSFNEINLSVFMLLAILNTIFYVWTTIPDQKGDLVIKKKTIGNSFSALALNLFNSILLIICFIFTFQVSNIAWILTCTMLISLIALFLKLKRIEFWIKLNLLVHGLCVTLFFMDYFFMMTIMFLLAKWYYRKRFDFDYPNLK